MDPPLVCPPPKVRAYPSAGATGPDYLLLWLNALLTSLEVMSTIWIMRS